MDASLDVWPVEGTFEPSSGGRWQFDLRSTADGVGGTLFFESPPVKDATSFGFFVQWVGERRTWRMSRRERSAAVPPSVVAAALARSSAASIPECLLLRLHWLHRNRIELLGQTIFDGVSQSVGTGVESANTIIEVLDRNVRKEAERSDLASPDGGEWITNLLQRARIELRQFLASRRVGGKDAWTQL